MPAPGYVHARQYAWIFRSSSLVSRAGVVTSALSTVGAGGVITRAITCSPLLQRRSKRSRSPCDHAFAVHDGEPYDQVVGVIVAADPEDVVETAIPHVAPGERLKPQLRVFVPDQVAIEMSPERFSSPALRV